MPLHAQLEARKNGVGFEVEHAGHLACHAETAYAALLCAIAQTQAAAAIRIDEVGHKALFAQLYLAQGVTLHELQART